MKKGITIILTIVLVFSLSVTALALTYLYPNGGFNKGDVTVIAHRGFSSEAPENTVAAFELAGKYGFDGIECDILPTKDNKWVIMHDDSVCRTTNGLREVKDYTYDEIRELKIDSGNNISEYPDEKVPSLEEYLEVCKKYKMCAFIEIKTGANEPAMANLFTIINSYKNYVDITIISFDRSALLAVRKDLSDIKTMFLTSLVTSSDIKFITDNGITGLDYSYTGANVNLLADAREKGISLGTWTVDTVSAAETQYNLGARFITTNTLIPSTGESSSFFTRITNAFQRIILLIKAMFSILK